MAYRKTILLWLPKSMKSVYKSTISNLSLKAGIHSKTVYYDGFCNLCNYTVQFIQKYSRKNTFDFIPFQYSQEIAQDKFRSVIFIDNKKVYTKSDAVLHILRYLKWPLSWFYCLIILPRFLRDGVYMLISKYRYKWFGECNCKAREL
jgi:predicted DCC family thiol-disulfide oxidoreductase YuxK